MHCGRRPLSGAAPLRSHSLEEGVAENAVRLSRSVKISNPCIIGFGIGDASLNRGFANALDHRGDVWDSLLVPRSICSQISWRVPGAPKIRDIGLTWATRPVG